MKIYWNESKTTGEKEAVIVPEYEAEAELLKAICKFFETKAGTWI